MFNNRSNELDSGLTEEDCKSMLAYLNKFYCPLPEYCFWESGAVPLHGSVCLGLKSHTPIVWMNSVNSYRHRHLHPRDFDLCHEKIYEFFEKNFKGQYYFNNDAYSFTITAPDVLDRLKKEAQRYNVQNEINQITIPAQKL